MRTPRVCCCSPPTGGPTRWWVECFGKRHEIWDECGEPYHYMPLFDETTTAGQAAYQGYFGGIPAVNSVWKLGGQGAFANGTILAQCGEIKTTAPTGRRLISIADFAASNGSFQSKTGCNDHDCKTHYRLKPCGYPFSQEVTNPPEIYWATDDYWDSVLTGGLPFEDSPKPGGCPSIPEAVYLVNMPSRDPYCAILDKPFGGATAQEVAQAQPPGGSTTYTRVDVSPTGYCNCTAPACRNLFIFDPCPGSPSGAYSMAADADEWQNMLGLPNTPDASTPSTYAGYWRFKRLNPGGSEYGCCNSPGGQLSDPTPEFCGSLRPRNANDLESDFCFGPGSDCSAVPEVTCTLTNQIGGRIQIIGEVQAGAAVNAGDWFTELDAPPQTGNACDRHECTDCFAVNCGDGKIFIEGVFELTYSCAKGYQGVRTFTPTRSFSGSMLHTLRYIVPYVAEMTFSDVSTLCDATPGPGCSGPIDTSNPIVIGRWTTSGSGITLGNITLQGQMDVTVNNVFPNASEVFSKTWAYVMPSFPGETIDLGGDVPVDVNPYVSLELQKRWGLRADVFDPELDLALCNANLSKCYTTAKASLTWTPKLLWGGSYFESDSSPPNSTSTNGVGALPVDAGFTMVRVVGDADEATCCESTPAYFNGPIIYANCAERFVDLNNGEISRAYDQEIQSPVGSLGGYAYSHESDTAHCIGNIDDPSKRVWTECGSWNSPENTAEGIWCDGYAAGRNLWRINYGSGGKIGPSSFWNVTNNQTYALECEMEHKITAIRCG